MFTSLADDTAGGDSNNNQATTTPAPGDWPGIHADTTSARVSLAFTQVRFAFRGLATWTADNNYGPAGAMSITDSTFSDNLEGINLDHTTSATLQRTTANRTSAANNGSPGAAMVVHGRLDPARISGNTGTGNALNGIGLVGDITTSGTLSSQPGWPIILGYPQDCYCANTPLVVPQGITLTLAAGTVTKSRGQADYYNVLLVHGTLIATGTAAAPVVFTSLADDTAGGDSNNNQATTPAPGDWPGIHADTTSVVTLDNTSLRFATTALAAADAAQVTIHGSILSSNVGVSSETYLDATNVDWGSPSGPAPYGTGTSVVGGGVWFTPWKGWVGPQRPPVAAPQADPIDSGCKDVLFIGVRGSGQLPAIDDSEVGTFPDDAAFGGEAWEAFSGFQQQLRARNANTTIKAIGLKYRAFGVVHNPFPLADPPYFNSVYDGVDKLIALLHQQSRQCVASPQRVVLAGYSQGALVIHLALRELAKHNADMLTPNALAGVILIADPAKTANGSETTWEGLNTPAGTGVTKASGLWAKALFFDSNLSGPLPPAVTNQTIAICRNHDIVCAPGFRPTIPGVLNIGVGLFEHLTYPAEASNAMGAWVANKFPKSAT